MPNKNAHFLFISSIFLFYTTPALAHPAHTASFSAGLLHPLLGLDHLLALLGLGLWSARQYGARSLAWPALFMLCLVLSALWAIGRPSLAWLDSGIAATVMSIGLLLALDRRLSVVTCGGVVATFGVLHGYAHGAELPATAAALPFVGGLIFTSVTLLGLPRLLNRWLVAARRAGHASLWSRHAGGLIAVIGAVLFFSA